MEKRVAGTKVLLMIEYDGHSADVALPKNKCLLEKCGSLIDLPEKDILPQNLEEPPAAKDVQLLPQPSTKTNPFSVLGLAGGAMAAAVGLWIYSQSDEPFEPFDDSCSF